jgi:ATP-dependent DNA ligase
MLHDPILSRYRHKHAPQLSSLFIPPLLPTLVDEPAEGGEWEHEIKYDGAAG